MCGFRPSRSTTDQISLSSKFLRNVGSMPKRSTCFVNLEKAYDRVPREKLLGVLRESELAAACHWLSSHCIPAQKFVCVGKVNSRPFTVGVGLRQRCVLSPLLFIISTT